jgi:hypothetical protein
MPGSNLVKKFGLALILGQHFGFAWICIPKLTVRFWVKRKRTILIKTEIETSIIKDNKAFCHSFPNNMKYYFVFVQNLKQN